jgi:hypothetical protein
MNIKNVRPVTAKEVTNEIIESWKVNNPRGIFLVAVNTDEIIGQEDKPNKRGRMVPTDVFEQKKGWVRKPSRLELSAAMSAGEAFAIAEDLFNTCWLGGDQELLDDDDYFQGAMVQFQGVMELRTGELKKL